MQDMVRVRIAPSPTGLPHIGTIYQALFNFVYAKKNQGKFIIRIEDTDRERFVEGAEEKIYEGVDWANLSEDESPRKDGKYGPYRQSERLSIYKKYAEELVQKGDAYYCFCTKERLDEIRKKLQSEKKPMMYDRHCRNLLKEEIEEKLKEKLPHVIRLKIPENEKIIIKDEIRGEIDFDSNLIDDQVLLKSDGFPTYHLAVVVDDHLMEITHVVRAEEWLSSTPKHFLLYDFFGWEKPLFFHTPTLRNPDKSKLSKRHGHTNIDWYIENGYLPEAILNFLALMGWSHPEEKEIFSLTEFTQLFDLKDLKPVGPIFDLDKLTWMNGVYIREKLTDEELKKKIISFYKNDEKVNRFIKENERNIDLIISLAKTRMKTLLDFKKLVLEPEEKYEFKDEDKKAAQILLSQMESMSQWGKDKILEALKNFKEKENIPFKKIYLFITGKEQGLPLSEMMEMMGKEKVISRLKEIIK